MIQECRINHSEDPKRRRVWGKVEGIIKAEIVRLAKRELKKSFGPLNQDVRALKGTLSQLRKTVTGLQRFAAQQEKERRGQRVPLEAPPEEVKKARFSPRLIKSLRKHLGVTQREMATLAGVTVGAIYQWEKGMFEPRGERKKPWWPFVNWDAERQGICLERELLDQPRRRAGVAKEKG